jgi:hypothetical protein
MNIEIAALAGAKDKKAAKAFMRDFIEYPKRLYAGDPYWVPWFDIDMMELLEKRHPFFLTSDAEFFMSYRDGKASARVMALDIPAYRRQHGTNQAFFYFFDFGEDGLEDARAVMDAAGKWAQARGLTDIEGPFLFGGASGSGLLIEGFDSPPPMTMMVYNRPYYAEFYAKLGLLKRFGISSSKLDGKTFKLPERIARIAGMVRERSRLKVLTFKRKRDMTRFAEGVASLYNITLADHPEDYPLSDAELARVKKDILFVARPKLMKILADGEKVVGYLFSFVDLSVPMRKSGGRTGLIDMLRLILGFRDRNRLIINGMGILPEYQKQGGNALLYTVLTDSVQNAGWKEAELTTVADSTKLMLADLQNLGAVIIKRYGVFTKKI